MTTRLTPEDTGAITANSARIGATSGGGGMRARQARQATSGAFSQARQATSDALGAAASAAAAGAGGVGTTAHQAQLKLPVGWRTFIWKWEDLYDTDNLKLTDVQDKSSKAVAGMGVRGGMGGAGNYLGGAAADAAEAVAEQAGESVGGVAGDLVGEGIGSGPIWWLQPPSRRALNFLQDRVLRMEDALVNLMILLRGKDIIKRGEGTNNIPRQFSAGTTEYPIVNPRTKEEVHDLAPPSGYQNFTDTTSSYSPPFSPPTAPGSGPAMPPLYLAREPEPEPEPPMRRGSFEQGGGQIKKKRTYKKRTPEKKRTKKKRTPEKKRTKKKRTPKKRTKNKRTKKKRTQRKR